MYGKTTPVLLNGINNAGTIWFQNGPSGEAFLPPNKALSAKLVPIVGGYEMQGWAWSDNLGWVSFYCRPSVNPKVGGVNCGNIQHGVTIDAAGVFHGWAWNDAMGWISMNSENHNPPALDPLGKPITYGLKMDKVGRITGYAWSPSLGWLNFGGVYAGIKITVPVNVNTPAGCPAASTAGLCGYFSPDPSILNPTLDAGLANSVKVADGVDKYILNLYFKDENGVDIPMAQFVANNYEAKVFFNWEDTVRRDQTNLSALNYEYAKISKPFQNGTGAILQKPVFLYTTADAADAADLFG